jgi:hypothetical protein
MDTKKSACAVGADAGTRDRNETVSKSTSEHDVSAAELSRHVRFAAGQAP